MERIVNSTDVTARGPIEYSVFRSTSLSGWGRRAEGRHSSQRRSVVNGVLKWVNVHFKRGLRAGGPVCVCDSWTLWLGYGVGGGGEYKTELEPGHRKPLERLVHQHIFLSRSFLCPFRPFCC